MNERTGEATVLKLKLKLNLINSNY